MSWIAAEIAEVEREHALGLRPLDVADRDRLRARIRARYGGADHWIWAAAGDGASIQHPDGWRWIRHFVAARPCILLFNAREEAGMFEVSSGDALDLLLGETTGFEFYVTDADASYLVCFDHHDFLVCLGGARGWLKGLLHDP